jgi:hypothetical protein
VQQVTTEFENEEMIVQQVVNADVGKVEKTDLNTESQRAKNELPDDHLASVVDPTPHIDSV